MKFALQIKKTFWMTLPFWVGLFLIFLAQVPVSLMSHYHQSFPFVTGLVFYFSIFNPKVLNAFWVFLLGLIMDMITTLPLGFYAFGFVFIYFMANLFQSYLLNIFFIEFQISLIVRTINLLYKLFCKFPNFSSIFLFI